MFTRTSCVLFVFALCGAAACAIEETPPGEVSPGDGPAPSPAPIDDSGDPAPMGTAEADEPNDVGHGAADFDLPALGAGSAALYGCFEPTGLDADRDAFRFDVPGPTYIEVSIEGSGDALAGFLVEPADDELAGDDWFRVAADVGATGVTRRVFLPKAGAYYLVASDARSIISGVAMGDATSCYRAEVTQRPMPQAMAFTGTTSDQSNGDPRLYAFSGDASAHISYGQLSYSHPGLVASVVVMRNGEYISSALSAGGTASALMPATGSDDEIVLVADTVFGTLPGASYQVAVHSTELLAEAGDGRAVGFDQLANGEPVELYFHAERGEMVHLGFLSDGWKYEVAVRGPDGVSTLATVCDWCSAASGTWISIGATGLHHVELSNKNAPAGVRFNVAFTRAHLRPAVVEIGGSTDGDLSDGARAWYRLDVQAGDSVGFAVESKAGDAFDAAEIRMYDASGFGEIDSDDPFAASVPLITGGTTSAGDPLTRSFYEDRSLLVSVSRVGAHTGDEAFELSVSREN